MNSKFRIQSLLEGSVLSQEVTKIPSFSIAQLKDATGKDIEISTKIRLGQLVEKVIGELLEESSNYQLLDKNVQVRDGKITIGELDFIVREIETQDVVHLELAYKFYLLDPSISSMEMENWIGPNRKDTLAEKLHKLKTKQFPLLFDARTQNSLPKLDVTQIRQELCLLANLYVPKAYAGVISESYKSAIKGWYWSWEEFKTVEHDSIQFFVPEKKQWGIAPSTHKTWYAFDEVKDELQLSMNENRSRLVWQKEGETFSELFVTWW